jgi:hypothetical protein
MKLGIMQPYVLPYLGYFQVIAAVDVFVLYDDVAFIKQGWINRNQLLVHGRPQLFSVPLQSVSSNRTIRDTAVSLREYARWKDKFLKTVALAYSKAPWYEPTRELIASVFGDTPSSIGELASRSIIAVCRALALPTCIRPSSTVYQNGDLRAQDRVLDICRRERATVYVNAPGGRRLYAREAFAPHGVELRFLRSRMPSYPQFNHPFVQGLSIVDILMFNSPEDARRLSLEYDLEE